MHFFLNGGRNERGVLQSADALDLYKRLGVSRLLVIPYAIKEDYWQELWHQQQDLFGVAGLEGRALTTFDTDKATIAEKLAWAEYIYLPGGAQQTLLKRMTELGTAELLRQQLAKSTIKLLGGGSAGAMAMGTECMLGHGAVQSVVPGLDLLPGYIIDSHFTNRGRAVRLEAELEQRPMLAGLGIDEDTGIVLDADGALQAVYGTGTVSLYRTNKKEVYDSNSQF